MWVFRKEFESAKIVTDDKFIVDRYNLTDELVERLIASDKSHIVYFEQTGDKNDDPKPQAVKKNKAPADE